MTTLEYQQSHYQPQCAWKGRRTKSFKRKRIKLFTRLDCVAGCCFLLLRFISMFMFSFIYGLCDGSDATMGPFANRNTIAWVFACRIRLRSLVILQGALVFTLFPLHIFLSLIYTQPTTQHKTKITTTIRTHIHFFRMQRIVFSNARLSSAAVCLPLSAWMLFVFRLCVCVCARDVEFAENKTVCRWCTAAPPIQWKSFDSDNQSGFLVLGKRRNERQQFATRAPPSLVCFSLSIDTTSVERRQQVKWALTKCSRRIVWHSRKKSFAIETVGRLNRALVNGIRVS